MRFLLLAVLRHRPYTSRDARFSWDTLIFDKTLYLDAARRAALGAGRRRHMLASRASDADEIITAPGARVILGEGLRC